MEEAHRRLLGAVESLTDAEVRRPSLLPGWSVGHVLSHLARNADSHVRRTEAAASGMVVDQYPEGLGGREAEIRAGSGRGARDLVDDVRRSATAVEAGWRAVAEGRWVGRSRDASGLERYLFELPARRWQEVEVHLVDLAIGITHEDWPDDFVREWLPRTRERMSSRLPADAGGPPFRSPAEELAWLYGRISTDDRPPAPPWG